MTLATAIATATANKSTTALSDVHFIFSNMKHVAIYKLNSAKLYFIAAKSKLNLKFEI